MVEETEKGKEIIIMVAITILIMLGIFIIWMTVTAPPSGTCDKLIKQVGDSTENYPQMLEQMGEIATNTQINSLSFKNSRKIFNSEDLATCRITYTLCWQSINSTICNDAYYSDLNISIKEVKEWYKT